MSLQDVFIDLLCSVIALNCIYSFIREIPESPSKTELRYTVSCIIIAASFFLSFWYKDTFVDFETIMIAVKVIFIFVVLISIHMLYGASTTKFWRYGCFNITRVKIVTTTSIAFCTWAFFALPK